MIKDKILTLQRLRRLLDRRGRRLVVFTNGCFDILHAGHVQYLEKAKAKGDILVVGLNADASVRRLKGKNRPINSQRDRASILAALESVDYVVVFNEDTPRRLIQELKPDRLVKGADWPQDRIVGADLVTARGGKISTIPILKGRSTTAVIKKIAQAS